MRSKLKGIIMLRKSILAVGAALLLVPASTSGAITVGSQPGKSFPLISGKYIVTINQQCQPSLSVTYGTVDDVQVVTGVNLDEAPSANTLGSGEIDATNSKGSGTFSINVTQSDGDPIVLNSNIGGTQGTILSVNNSSGSIPFTQTATTLALTDDHGVSTYNIFYGPAKGGVAESAVFGGMDDTGCMEIGSVSQQK